MTGRLKVINKGRPGRKVRVHASRTQGAKVRAARVSKPKRGDTWQSFSKRVLRANRKAGPAALRAAGSAWRKSGVKPSAHKSIRPKRNPSTVIVVGRAAVPFGESTMAKRRRKSPARDAKGHFVKRGRGKRSASVKARRRRAKSNPGLASTPQSRAIGKRVRAAAASAAPKARKRVKAKPRSVAYKRTSARIHQVQAGIATQRKKHGGKRRSTPAHARLAVLKWKRKAFGGGVGADARKYLADHGLMKVNASGIGESFKRLGNLIPEMLLSVGVAGLVVWAGSKAGDMLKEKYPLSPLANVAVPLAAASVTVGGFLALRASPKTQKWSGVFAVAGAIGTGVLTLTTVQVEEAGAKISLGRKIGLPIGDGSPLLPGMNLGMDLRGYGPRSQLTALGAYMRRDATPHLLQGYEARGAVNALSSVQPIPADEKAKGERALGRFHALEQQGTSSI